MSAILYRLWYLGTLFWWGYNVLEYKGGIAALFSKPWKRAWEIGTNNMYCQLDLSTWCQSISVSYWERTELNETFGLIVRFAGIPAGILAAIFLFSIVFRG